MKDINALRVKSGRLQDAISGQMKRRIRGVGEIIKSLIEKVITTGDFSYQRIRNTKLMEELGEMRRKEMDRMREIENLKKIVRDLRQETGVQKTREVPKGKERETEVREIRTGTMKGRGGGKENPIPLAQPGTSTSFGSGKEISDNRKVTVDISKRLDWSNVPEDEQIPWGPIGKKEITQEDIREMMKNLMKVRKELVERSGEGKK